MKKTFALPLIAASLFAALFISCANMEDAPAPSVMATGAGVDGGAGSDGAGTGAGTGSGAGQSGAQEPVIVTVGGSLDFGGAFPEQIAALVDNTLGAGQGGADGLDGIAASAFPGTPDASGLTYTVYALEDLPADSTETPLRYEGTVADDGKSYTVGIPVTEGKKYYVYANAANSDELVLLSGKSAVLDFTTITSFKTDVNITLAATQTATGTGLVSLAVGDPDQKAVSACVCYKVGSTDYEKNLTKSGSGTDTVWTLEIGEIKTDDGTGQKYIDSGIKSGAHLMTFEFYSDVDASGTLLYSFKESVSVFDNLTTNTWIQNGAEPWFVTTASAGVKTTTCKVTAAMVQGYALTDIYVNTDLSVGDDAGSGSFMHPKATFAAAVGMLVNENADYTIHIKDIVEEGQTIPPTIRAKSLTLCGETPLPTTGANAGVPQDIIDAQEVGGKSALLIETTVPITIKNLKITGGRGAKDEELFMGGGIFLKAEGGSLTLASGAYVSENQATDRGGGICLYPACSLNILDGAVIEKNKSNGKGGGIFCKSTPTKKAVITMSGGHIRGNTARGDGGALNLGYGTFTMTGGVIGDDTESISQAAKYGDDARLSECSNTADQGGAIYSSESGHDNFDIYLLGGTIAYNCAQRSGGAIYLSGGNMTVKNAKIQYNGAGGTSYGKGGAFYLYQNVELHLEDCSIIGNEIYGGARALGGAICVQGPEYKDDTPNIYLKGSVSIPSDDALKNDIVLQKNSNTDPDFYECPALTIEGKLTGSGKVARITPIKDSTTNDYDVKRVVLKLADGVTDTNLAQECYKFDVTPQASPAQDWAVGSDGCLAKLTTLTSANIGDFSVADFSVGAKVVYVFDSTVTNDQIEVFTEKLYHSTNKTQNGVVVQTNNPDSKMVGAGSVLDFSKATGLTNLGFSWSNYGVMQPFDIILPPKAASNLFGNMTFVWAIQSAQKVIAPPDCTYYTSEDGIVYSKDKKKLCLYPGGRPGNSWTVPNTVTSLGYYAFAYGNNLKNVSLPSGLLSIGQSAFYSSKIESLTIPASVTQIDYRAFGYGMSSLASLVFENPSGWKTKDNNGNILMTLDATKLSTPGNDTTEGSTLYYFKNTVDQYYNWSKLVRN